MAIMKRARTIKKVMVSNTCGHIHTTNIHRRKLHRNRFIEGVKIISIFNRIPANMFTFSDGPVLGHSWALSLNSCVDLFTTVL